VTDKKTSAQKPPKPRDKAGARKGGTHAKSAHTELRAAGKKPQPRSKVMPPEVARRRRRLFNDMPV
jgi:hypothetical protein